MLPNVVLNQIHTDTTSTSKHVNPILIGIPSHQDVAKITHENTFILPVHSNFALQTSVTALTCPCGK